MPIISVIIPVYNVEKYLSECLDSVVNQTYQNLEILLIDDGSKDKSPLICDEYAKKDARIKVIHKENGGVSSARNLGLDIAKGDYIMFIDSDDLVSKNYVESLYNNLIENNSDLSFCRFSYLIDGVIKEIKEDFPNTVCTCSDKNYMDFLTRLLSLKNNIMGSSWRVLYKKNIVADLRFNVNVFIMEDLLFVLNVVLKSKVISFVDEYLYFYRINNASALHRYKKNFLRNQYFFIAECKNLLDKFDNKVLIRNKNCHFAMCCYSCFTNEIKYRKQNKETYRKNIKEIKKSELYKYFKLKYAFNVNFTIKYIFVWFLIKLKLV